MSRRTIATQRLKTMACSYCHLPIEVGTNTRKAPHHFECGLKAAVTANREMAAHEGAAYEKWQAGMKRFTDRFAPPTPPPSQIGLPQ
jgi:hypothetical protein